MSFPFRFLVIAALLPAMAVGQADAEAEPPVVSIYVVEPAISNHAIQAHKELPGATCRPGTKLSMVACRGEYEPASFVIETTRPLKDVFVEVGPLRSGAETIDADAVDVRVVKSCWLRISDFPGRMNWVLLHDPDLLKIIKEADTEPYSAGMSFTRRPVDTQELQPADVAARRQFWLTVRVPDDSRAGTYTGTISITAANVSTQTLTLTLEVPAFELRAPDFEYSVFYATKYHSDLMRINEYRNMVAHGCMNPSFYDSVELADDGVTLDFSELERELSFREKVGMKPGGPLYLVSSGPINAGTTGLSDAELAQLSNWVKQTVAWIHAKGYDDVYFMGSDEATGERLTAQRPTWAAIHKGGGRVFISNYGGFSPHVGDVVDLAVITHPSGNPIDTANTKSTSPDAFLAEVAALYGVIDCVDWILDPASHDTFNPPDYPSVIAKMHERGGKVFTYMDSLAGGYGIPEVQRRLRGLGMWKAKLDGTMPWSYHHFMVPPHLEAGPLHWSNFHSFVLRGAEAPFDTLSWEAYREGYDDARYLATLQHAIAACRAEGKHPELVTETENWLEKVPTDVDLDTWRRQMIVHTEKLLGLAPQ